MDDDLASKHHYLIPIAVFGYNGPARKVRSPFIATTGRIITIDSRARILRVSSDGGSAILQLKSPSAVLRGLEQFTVITTDGTVFQDGAERIRFEDFNPGETISIHGLLRSSILTAFRVAK